MCVEVYSQLYNLGKPAWKGILATPMHAGVMLQCRYPESALHFKSWFHVRLWELTNGWCGDVRAAGSDVGDLHKVLEASIGHDSCTAQRIFFTLNHLAARLPCRNF